MYRCPRCQNFASIGPGLCWKCGATLIEQPQTVMLRLRGAAAQPVSASAGFVITNAQQQIIRDGHIATIGGLEDWTLTGLANTQAIVTQLAISFNIPDAVVGNYTPTEQESTLTPFHTGGNHARFYWTQSGPIQVTLVARVNQILFTQTITVNVATPTLVRFDATTTQSVIVPTLVFGRDAAHWTNFLLSFGTGIAPGIVFDIHVTTTAAGGQVTMLQLVKLNRSNNRNYRHGPGANSIHFVLDQAVHYGFRHQDQPAASLASSSSSITASSDEGVNSDEEYDSAFDTFTFAAKPAAAASSNTSHSGATYWRHSSGSEESYSSDEDDTAAPERLSPGLNQFQATDAPQTLAGLNGMNAVHYERVEVNEEYRMFVMFQPPGGIWVALGEIKWCWKATAVFDALANVWVISRSGVSWENCTLNRTVLFCRLPQWKGNASDFIDKDH